MDIHKVEKSKPFVLVHHGYCAIYVIVTLTLNSWSRFNKKCDNLKRYVHINKSHKIHDQCLIFHYFVSKFVLLLQVFNLFTQQCF
jgi:hypothetical protein